MGYEYTYIDGCRVELHVAAAFRRLAAEFLRRTGCELHIRDATRTNAEQWIEWNKYQNGGNLAAYPGTSNHEEDGPIGPRALDLYDSGADDGVTVIGSWRSNVLVEIAPAYQFTNAGHYFWKPEGWHYEFTGALSGDLGSDSAGWNRTDRSTADIQRLVGASPDGIYGPETDAKLRAWQGQNRLDADGVFGILCDAVGFSIDTDGDPGVKTYAKLQHRVGAGIDGQIGPSTWSHLQAALGVPDDGIPGSDTYAALQKAVGANVDRQIGPDTWRKTQAFLNTGAPFPKVGLQPAGPSTPNPAPAARPNDPAVPGVWLGAWSANREQRTGTVGYFVVHHADDTRDPAVQVQRFMSPNDRSVSPTWFVGADGIARKIVHPDDRQWTTGRIIDQQAVTVETQNTSREPTWGISDAAHEEIAQLVAWTAKRYGFPIDRAHVLGHNEARAQLDPSIGVTACPGPSMDLDRIVKRAQQIASPVEPKPDPELPILTPDAATFWQRLLEWLRDFFKGAK